MEDITKIRAKGIVDYSIRFLGELGGFDDWWNGVDREVRGKRLDELTELVSVILAQEPYGWIRGHLSKIGKIGGSVKSEAKARAVRENGKKGGRPRRQA